MLGKRATHGLASFLAAVALALLLFAGLLIAKCVWIAAQWSVLSEVGNSGSSDFSLHLRYDLARMYLDPIILFIVPSALLAKMSSELQKRRICRLVLLSCAVLAVCYFAFVRPPLD